MGRFWTYLRQTVIAGIFLLAPFVVLFVLLEKVYMRVHPVVHRAAATLGWDRALGSMTVSLLSVLLLLVVCFLAGLVMRLPVFRALREAIERNLLRFIPGYEYAKVVLAEKLGAERGSHAPTVLVEIDGWQPAILVEETADGRCVVYVPGAPGATSGSVHIMDAASVRRLDAPLSAILKSLRFYGRGLGRIATGSRQAQNE